MGIEPLETRWLLSTVQLLLTADPVAHTYEVRATVDSGDNIGLAGFSLDVVGSNGVSVASSLSVAPRGDVVLAAGGGPAGFINQVIDGNPGPGQNVTGLQDTGSQVAGRVILGIGQSPGTIDDLSNGPQEYDANVLIAQGTFSGDAGTLTAVALAGGASVLPQGWTAGDNPVQADTYLGATIQIQQPQDGNTPPVANDDTATTDSGVPVSIAVLANDSDPDSDPLSVSSFTQGQSGSVTAGTGGALIYSPQTDFTGSDSFTYTISDGRGGTDTATVTVDVSLVSDQVRLAPDPLNPGQQALFIDGTPGRDQILVRPTPNNASIVVNLNRVVRGTFALADVSRIVVDAQGGNDTVAISNRLTMSTEIRGGSGRDKLIGGGGNDVILGGSESGHLLGRRGTDVLIGGGQVRAQGGSGDDLLVAGTTVHDANSQAIQQILQTWSSSASYSDRVSALRSGTALPPATGSIPALNSATVVDNGVLDRLYGQDGFDWFVMSLTQDRSDDRDPIELIN